jgi:hypothetical protein
MKIINYIGADGECIVIQRPQDLYPLLDWFHTQLMDLGATETDVSYVSKLIDKVEADGYGNFDDVENVEYS